MSESAFSATKVIDLTHVLAGPFCTYQLALLGAEVIKVEPPDAPDCARGRGPSRSLNAQGLGVNYQVQGANKRAVALDLKKPAGKTVFLRLIDSADVLVENYRAGALARIGLGPDDLLARNPRLVYCSITGFGQEGPEAERNAYDNVIQAASGMMAQTGDVKNPIKTGASIIDYATGMCAAFAVAAALRVRDKTGEGQHVDCAMMDAALMGMAPEWSASLFKGVKNPTPKEAGLGVYETQDGKLMLGAFNIRQNRRLWELLENPGFAALENWEDLWTNADAMRAQLKSVFATDSAAAWEKKLNDAGVPARRIRALAETARNEGLLRPSFHAPVRAEGCDDDVSVPLTPFTLATGGAAISRPPPRFGEHTRDVLAELGYSESDIENMIREGAAR